MHWLCKYIYLTDWWTDVGHWYSQRQASASEMLSRTQQEVWLMALGWIAAANINYRRSSDIRSCWGTQSHKHTIIQRYDSFIKPTETETTSSFTSVNYMLYTTAQKAELRFIHVFNISVETTKVWGNKKKLRN